MKNKYVRSIISAILASTLLSILIALLNFTPKKEQLSNSYYSTISELFILHFFYMIPAFIVGGFVSVFLISILMKHFILFINHPYFFSIFLHILGAIIISFSYLILLSKGFAFLDEIAFSQLSLIALSGSLLYLHLYVMCTKLFTGKAF